MQYFQSIGGIRVLASKPGDADAAFIAEAKKRGFNLYNVAPYNIRQGSFGQQAKYFANKDETVIITPQEYLIFFPDGQWLEAHENIFSSIFKPNGNIDENIPLVPASKPLQGRKFYLDAGHGGGDPGAINNNFGLQEKIAALDIILKLGLILEMDGAEIYYSRIDNNTLPGLSQRANEANAAGVNAFISVHLNSAEPPKDGKEPASGIETLVYSLTGTAAQLAAKVQANMVVATGFKNRGVKARPDLTVLSKTKMPAILCEVGFISNDEEAQKLFQPTIQEKIANAIANGVIAQFGA